MIRTATIDTATSTFHFIPDASGRALSGNDTIEVSMLNVATPVITQKGNQVKTTTGYASYEWLRIMLLSRERPATGLR